MPQAEREIHSKDYCVPSDQQLFSNLDFWVKVMLKDYQ